MKLLFFLALVTSGFATMTFQRTHLVESADSVRKRPSPFWRVPLQTDSDPISSQAMTDEVTIPREPVPESLIPKQTPKPLREGLRKSRMKSDRLIRNMKRVAFAKRSKPYAESELLKEFSTILSELEIPHSSETAGEILLPAWANLPFLIRRINQAGPIHQLHSLRLYKMKSQEGGRLVYRTDSGHSVIHLKKELPRARVCILVDDVGYHGEGIKRYLKMNMPLTISILPFYETSPYFARRSRQLGFEVMLHMPMQSSFASYYKYENLIRTGLSPLELLRRTRAVMQAVPLISGVNNHEGSRATEDAFTMNLVMSEMARHGVYFIDSVTSQKSVAYDFARQYNIAAYQRNFDFLDNDKAVASIQTKIDELIRYALRHPRRIVLTILHEKEGAAIAVESRLQRFRELGIEIMSPGDFLEHSSKP